MTTWMLYAAALGTLLWLFAEVLARGARGRGRPERWIWVGGLAGSLLLPVLLPLLPRATGAAVGHVVLPGISTGGASAGLPAPGPELWTHLPALLWAVASLALLLRLVRAGREVGRIVRRSPTLRRHPVQIRLTRATGPAVVGLAHPVILLPRRFPGLPFQERRWILRHELEHIRAGDPALVWLSRILQILTPWNPAVWIMGRRLREGLEFDCDRRVLARRPDPRSYGETLLALVTPSSSTHLPVAAFREPLLSLKRRFNAMTTPTRTLSPRALAFLGAAAVLLLAGACEFSPTFVTKGENSAPEEAPASTVFVAEEVQRIAENPTFTPYTVAPDLSNRTEVMAALESEYPPLLRDAGIGGTATIWFFINKEGRVEDTRIQESSGHQGLDEAALRVAGAMRFTPALNRDEVVPVWVAFPITFQTR